MKICPKCQKTYRDESLNFCLGDGAVLQQISGREALPDTVFIQTPRRTASPASDEQPTQPNQRNLAAPPPPNAVGKSSKTWLWALGIIGLVIVVCGGGLIGLVGLISTIDVNSNTGGNANFSVNRNSSNASVFNSAPRNAGKNSPVVERTAVRTINLDKWATGASNYGNAEYVDGELILESRQKGFYYVLVASREFSTDSANTRISVRNVNEESTNLGFGLVFHSNPTPLVADYAFLIDTVEKKYRIVRHESQNEISLVNWTTSPAIKSGTEENILEVRDAADVMDFYINGTPVNSLKESAGKRIGVAGIYAGDAIKIAFSDFEIRK